MKTKLKLIISDCIHPSFGCFIEKNNKMQLFKEYFQNLTNSVHSFKRISIWLDQMDCNNPIFVWCLHGQIWQICMYPIGGISFTEILIFYAYQIVQNDKIIKFHMLILVNMNNPRLFHIYAILFGRSYMGFRTMVNYVIDWNFLCLKIIWPSHFLWPSNLEFPYVYIDKDKK